MKIIDELTIAYDARDALTMQELRDFVKKHEKADVTLRHSFIKSDHRSATWEVIDNATMAEHPVHPDLQIDPDDRWILADNKKTLARKPTESINDWRARVDEYVFQQGYYVDPNGRPWWIAFIKATRIANKRAGTVTVEINDVKFKVYPVGQ